MPSRTLLLPLCLAATWIIWGSTYLAIRYALISFPPFLLSGLRYLLAGLAMVVIVKLLGTPWPSLRQTRNSVLIGVLMLTIGNGLVCVAEQTVASGAAALLVASTPVLTVLANRLLGQRARRLEWLGLGTGVIGVVLMNLDQSLAADPNGVLLILAACVSWAIASAMIPRLDLPDGAMSSTIQMLTCGALSLPIALLTGERLPDRIEPVALGALLYLSVAGSMLAYSAYVWLLRHARPALATSSCYVNPVVALLLGWLLADEAVTWPLLAGMVVVLAAVALISLGQRKGKT
ncbi:drug/metabolite exporter YedA [Chitinimonas lacunae]|uniref:Drug/metabolite exporter YedA n=1 Tax=Chitinimonas lacunae TaxID=1963018 RepID=A0ABV8MTY2_9NEIS